VHHSAVDNIRTTLRRHVLGDSTLADRIPLEVLEVAAAGRTAHYEPAFGPLKVTYTVAGPDAGAGIDVITGQDGRLAVPDESFDVVLAGWGIEQSTSFDVTWLDMVRVCRRDGVIIVVAPTSGPPVSARPSTGQHVTGWLDRLRLLPDAMEALASAAGIRLTQSWVDPRGPWHNVVGVFHRTPASNPPDLSAVPPWFPAEVEALQNKWPTDAPAEVERGKGTEYYTHLLQRVHQWLAPRSYLEIGVSTGQSLRMATCPAVGIDPDPHPSEPMSPNHDLVRHTSDDVFAFTDIAHRAGPFDLAFIDGMHLVENVLLDFMNTERHCHEASVVLLDDPCPAHPMQAERIRVSQFWTGDVWKIIPILRRLRPDLLVLIVDTDPTATLMIIGTDPSNNVLWEHYDDVLDEVMADAATVDEDVLMRTGAIDPADPLLRKVLTMLAAGRTSDDPGAAVAQVRDLIAGSLPRTVAPV
jgi:hypothetical protein